MKRIIIKRIFTIFFITIIFGLMSWSIFQSLKPDVLTIGSTMPELRYFDGKSNEIIIQDRTNNTMIMLFHKDCGHCQYQLQQLNANLDKFEGTKNFLLTTDNYFFRDDSIRQKWPTLACSQSIQWGIVKRKDVISKLGRFVFPTIFLFDDSARFCFKIKGEVKMQKIISELKNLGGPER